MSFSKVQLLLDQLLGVEISRGALSDMRQRLSASTGNADGANPKGKRGWLWV